MGYMMEKNRGREMKIENKKIELPDFLIEMSKQMNEQSSRSTAHPFWQVRCKEYIATEEGINESHWCLYGPDSEGLATYSTKPFYDNADARKDFEEKNKGWCKDWIDENVDSGYIGEDSQFTDFFDFEEHKDNFDDWPEGYHVVHLQEIEKIVSTHLTEHDAKNFIARKQHDYPKLYTYVESAYWAPQLKQLQDWIISLEGEK